MINKKFIVIFFVFIIVETIILFVRNPKIEGNSVEVPDDVINARDDNYFHLFKEKSKKLLNVNKPNDSNNENIVNEIQYPDLPKDEDWDYVIHYQGQELEPEWQWVKNISIVYTWVDGNDVDFLDIKSKYNGGNRSYNSRDRSADELRYSIRSLTKYLPWHKGQIYIVTNDQTPKWLDTTNPRIKVVSHREMFPKHVFPTYDSTTIELFLDKIPGITERFIYFNDDIFINNYIHPAFFFTSKNFYPKVYQDALHENKKETVDRIIRLNNIHEMFQASKYFTEQIIKEYFDENYEYHNLCHTGHVFYRDLMEPFRRLFKEELKVVLSDKFRSPYKFHAIYLYQNFLYYATRDKDFPKKLSGNEKARAFEGYTLPENRTIEKYSAYIAPLEISRLFIKYGKITNSSKANKRLFNLFKKKRSLLVYNFNDFYTTENAFLEFTNYMISRYPEPSEFEKAEYVELEEEILPIVIDESNLSTNVLKSVERDYSKSFVGKFKKEIEQYKLNTIKEYLNIKDSLSGPKKEFSDREVDEVSALFKYRGRKELSPLWRWTNSMSFVYILENASDRSANVINELKYSLRSVKKYLPWFKGDIFIITQKEVTDELVWLNTKNSRIHVINQDQILPSEAANTKNVHVLEMYLDKIPGLSERFVYLKNNHFFIRYTHPRFFFNVDLYPKYNLKNPLKGNEIFNERGKNKSFYHTYDIIKDYFGINYVSTIRYFKDAPYPFYRDLFEPCRQLYKNEAEDMLSHTEPSDDDFLFLYAVATYNIYGTEQPYYPEFVTGYGKIREAPLPVLNEKRTIDFYGFDITSPYISDNTMITSMSFTNDSTVKQKMMNELIHTRKLFFSIKNDDYSRLTKESVNELINLMESLYPSKSYFEI